VVVDAEQMVEEALFVEDLAVLADDEIELVEEAKAVQIISPTRTRAATLS
jgi:hypothetical protein